MINLALKQNQDHSLQQLRVRKMVLTATSVVLGIWVVALGGFLGWTWYVDSRGNKIDLELKSLQSQVAALSEEEILVRKLATRSTLVNTFLDSRGDPVRHLDNLLMATPPAVAWDYKSPAVQTIKIEATSVSEVEAFVDMISQSYTNVVLDSLDLSKSSGWAGKISVGGLKK